MKTKTQKPNEKLQDEIRKREQETGEAIRGALSNLRRFSYLKPKIFTMLKTTKKEMMIKEVESLNRIIASL